MANFDAEMASVRRRRAQQRREILRQTRPAVAAYDRRSSTSGYRKLKTAAGGTVNVRYYSNAVPPSVPEAYFPGVSIGMPGTINTRPS